MEMDNKETGGNDTTTGINESSENIVNNKSKQWPQYLAATSASIISLSIGTVLGWSAPGQLLIMPDDGNSPNFISQYNFKMTNTQFSAAVASISLSAAIFGLFMGTIQNILGRKFALLLLIIPSLIGWGMIMGAQNFATFLIGRIFCGLTVGGAGVAITTYVGEISDKRIRGRLGTYYFVGISFGILLVYAVGATQSLLAINIVCLIIPAVFGIVFAFMPESPYYLVFKERYTDAISSLKWFRGENYDTTAEMEEIKNHIQLEKTEKTTKTSIWKLLKTKEAIKGILISLALMAIQQWSGVNAVTFYTGFIFQQARITLSPFIATICVGALQASATYAGSTVMDRLGRRILFMLSIIIMFISTIMIGVFFYLLKIKSPHIETLGWLPVFSLCLYIAAFSIGVGPIPILFVGEIFSHDVKPIGVSLPMSFSWILSYLIAQIFPYLTTSLGNGETFWLFSGCLFVGFFFVLFFVPETKNKSLTEIQEMLRSGGNFVKLC